MYIHITLHIFKRFDSQSWYLNHKTIGMMMEMMAFLHDYGGLAVGASQFPSQDGADIHYFKL